MSQQPDPRRTRAESPGWRSQPALPIIGVTADLADNAGTLRAQVAMAYARAVAAVGGLPIVLPPIPELAAEHVRRCHAVVLTGGDDPRTEQFGVPTHAKATPMRPERQAYELALLDALRERQMPVLGVCLGMQLMALHAGGRLDQHMADTRADAARHWGQTHPIVPVVDAGAPPAGRDAIFHAGHVLSRHRQAVDDAGRLAILAHADDGVIEAIADPARPFYIGVQWHPERTEDPHLGLELFRRLIDAARRDPSQQPG